MSRRIAIVFPGQGSQSVGMGQDIFESDLIASNTLKQAFDTLGAEFQQVCFEGPKDQLTLTQYAQPLIFAVSAAMYDQLKENGIEVEFVAGHSLGELTAYYASGALSFTDTLALIQKRGQEMAASYPHDDSAMSAVMGMDEAKLQSIVSACEAQPVVAANFNCPGQIVISGTKAAVQEATASIKAEGGKCIPLPVSGAFHSPLMETASDNLATYVDSVSVQQPSIPIILNRTAEAQIDAAQLKDNIALQVKSSVKWDKSMLYLQEQGIDTVIECGPGKVLNKLIQKTCSLEVFNVNSLESLKSVSEELSVKV